MRLDAVALANPAGRSKLLARALEDDVNPMRAFVCHTEGFGTAQVTDTTSAPPRAESTT